MQGTQFPPHAPYNFTGQTHCPHCHQYLGGHQAKCHNPNCVTNKPIQPVSIGPQSMAMTNGTATIVDKFYLEPGQTILSVDAVSALRYMFGQIPNIFAKLTAGYDSYDILFYFLLFTIFLPISGPIILFGFVPCFILESMWKVYSAIHNWAHGGLSSRFESYAKWHDVKVGGVRIHHGVHFGIASFTGWFFAAKILAAIAAITVPLLPHTTLAASQLWTSQADFDGFIRSQTVASSDDSLKLASVVTGSPGQAVEGQTTQMPYDFSGSAGPGDTWTVTYPGGLGSASASLGSSDQGWTINFDGTNFTITVPTPGFVGTGYTVSTLYNSGYYSAGFDVVTSNVYTVGGAGSAYVNGTYVDQLLGGRDLPAYLYSNGSADLYIYADGGGSWYLGDTLDNFSNFLYKTSDQASAPGGLTWVTTGGSGSAPPPTVVAGGGTFQSAGTAYSSFDGQTAYPSANAFVWNSLTKSETLNSQTITYYVASNNTGTAPTVPSAATAGTASNWTGNGWTAVTFSGNTATLASSLSGKRYLYVAVYMATSDTSVTPSVESLSLDYDPITTTVSSPNGGETFLFNQTTDTYGLSWSTTGSSGVDHIHLQYSTNSGSSWSDISGATALTANTTSYNWDTPDSSSSTVRIKVILENSSNTELASDTSNADFTLTYDTTAPTVTITSPTSSATYSTNTSTITLSGTASDANGLASSNPITYTVNGGGSQNATGSTSWSTSSISLNSGSNTIVVTATDAAGNTNTDTLTVTYTPPSISLTSPNGGECYLTGTGDTISGCSSTSAVSQTTIIWSSSGTDDADHIRLEYSTNNGGAYTTISSAISKSATTYDWTLPTSTDSTQMLIRITLEDSGNTALVQDTSNAVFTLHSNTTPNVTPTAPSDGASY